MTKLESLNERLNHSKNGLRETETELSGLETNTKVNGLKGEIKEDPNAGKIIDTKRISSDGYKVYSYIVKDWALTGGIKRQAVKQLKLKNDKGIIITNINGEPKHGYGQFHRFKKGEKVYVKIPQEHKESENKVINGMKCKGGEYFGIDVSRYNNEINLASFKERNNKKRQSPKKDKRGVSFIYIRVGDGHPNAKPSEDKKSLTSWTNFIKEHNNDRTVKDQHEQIATGFYWTLTNKKDAITQANDFLKIYNNYKDIPGGNKLVPMIDLETDRFTEVKKSHKNKKGKTIIDERYTPQQFKENALKRLQHVEQKTGIVPGLYIGAAPYGRYIRGDERFNKYLTRITAYPDSDSKTGREKGTARRINFEKGSVKVGPSSRTIEVKPDMYQSSQEGTVDGTSAKVIDGEGRYKKTYHDTDMDHTKDITKLFSKNNKSR